MESAGVATRLEAPSYFDRGGNVVSEQELAHGRKCEYVLTHPEMGLLFDEVGSNTAQSGDGLAGKERIIGRKGEKKKKPESCNNFHYTVLPITTFAGVTLMCVVIFAGSDNWFTAAGIDHEAEVIGKETDDDFFDKNCGPGKLFPGGPTMTYKGIDVPCLVRFTKKGSINGTILCHILMTIDKLDLMKRSDNPNVTPFFLCDAHGSRLSVKFLTYINNPQNRWRGFLGCPNATNLWQFHDAEECNGVYNCENIKAKGDKIEQKRAFGAGVGMSTHIEKHEAIILLDKPFRAAFCNIERNLRALSDRGWNPLNRQLLNTEVVINTATEDDKREEVSKIYFNEKVFEHIHVTSSASSNDTCVSNLTKPSCHNSVPPSLNVKTGAVGTLLQRLADDEYKTSLLADAKKRHEQSFSKHDAIMKIKKLSGGTIFSAGESELGLSVLEYRCKSEREKAVLKRSAQEKKRLIIRTN